LKSRKFLFKIIIELGFNLAQVKVVNLRKLRISWHH